MKKHILIYTILLIVGVIAFLGIAHLGENWFQTTPAVDGFAPAPSTHSLEHFLLVLITVIFSAKAMGFLFQYIKQPQVMGEVIAGIALGPSLLGAISPSAYEFLLPKTVLPLLGMFSQIGVIAFMFLVGIELDKKLLKNKGAASIAISHASIICPFLLGSGLSLFLFRDFAPVGVPFLLFSLFMGVALSITAFPVLARILTDLKITRSPMAAVTLTCAAVDDVTAWCLLALLIGLAKASLWEVAVTIISLAIFVLFVFIIVRPLMKRLEAKTEQNGLSGAAMIVIIVGMLASALMTELIGVHALFGSFLLGTLIEKESKLGQQLTYRLEHFVLTILLPLFFAFTGMRTQIGLINSWEQWIWCGAIIATAITGKIGGATLASRLSGIDWRDSLAVGVLMNTRGLVELIILNVGLELGILSPRLFTMMVIMAVFTTLMTTPLFKLITRTRPWTSPVRKSSPQGLMI